MNKNQLILHCNQCNHETYHDIVSDKSVRDEMPEVVDGQLYDFWQDTAVQGLRCSNCKSFSFRTFTIWCDEALDESPEKNLMLFPKRGTESIPLPGTFKYVPPSIVEIYRETVEAFNNGINRLCAGGIRATIEAVCDDKEIKNGKLGDKISNKLAGKINGLFEHGYLTQNHSEILHEHRYLGNEALHELSEPTTEELRMAIEIIAHTLDMVYEILPKGRELKNRKQAREMS